MSGKSFISAFLMFAICFSAFAQKGGTISGIVVDAENNEPVIQAVVELLQARDSTRVGVCTTELDGKFSLEAPAGRYIVKISMLGYVEQTLKLSTIQSQRESDIGRIKLFTDSYWIDAAKIVSKVAPVTVVGDTVVYNSAAYRVAEDASISELLEKIPGLEVKGNSIVLQGRKVQRILMNGKSFTAESLGSTIKNLPADMIENVRAYQRQSEEALASGVEDGNEETVLDLTVKKSFMDGWRSTLSAGGGSGERYEGRYNANKIADKSQYTVLAKADNEPSSGLSGETERNRMGGGASGDEDASELGLTFAKDGPEKSSSGNLRYSFSDNDALHQTRSQSIMSSSNSYSASSGSNLSQRHSLVANYNLQYRPSDLLTVIIKPSLTYNNTSRTVNSEGASFKDEMMQDKVNSTLNSNDNRQDNLNARINGQLTWRMQKRGRTLSLSGNASYSVIGNSRYQDNSTRYYKIKSNPDSLLRRIYDMDESTGTLLAQTGISYNEPLAKHFSLQGTVRVQLRKIFYERTADCVSNPLLSEASQGEYRIMTPEMYASLRYQKKKLYLLGGATVSPQFILLETQGWQKRSFELYASPFVTARFNRRTDQKLEFTYRGNSGQPSLYNILPVTSSTNPLNIHIGNADLKPPYVQNAQLTYNRSDVKSQGSFILSGSFSTTRNAASNSTTYDEDTGGRTVTAKNINGNWRTGLDMVWNKTLPGNAFSVSSHTWANYQESKSYLYNKTIREDEINTARRLLLREKFEGCYRNSWLEMALNATAEYTGEKNMLRPGMNQTPYSFGIGLAPVIVFPWKMRLSSTFDLWCQRGYSYPELNKNYLLWNATLSQSLFKGKAVARVSVFDILDNQENLVRTFSAERRSTSTYNGVNRYAMLRLLWKFGRKKGRS